MNAKRRDSVRTYSRRDEPPEVTDRWVAEAELHKGKALVRRGRPRLASPRKLLSLRLPQSVIATWKSSGPGWQTRMAEVLERSGPRARRHTG